MSIESIQQNYSEDNNFWYTLKIENLRTVSNAEWLELSLHIGVLGAISENEGVEVSQNLLQIFVETPVVSLE